MTGVDITDVFKEFFNDLDRNYKILEIGCNVGVKLQILKNMGFKNLYGLEMNPTAFNIAKKNNPSITFFNSTIEDFNSEGEQFDIVFTYAVLIHQNPIALESIIHKIMTLTKKYIFGYEYFSDQLEEVGYRGKSNVMWKQNFPAMFQKLYPSLKYIKEKKIPYKDKKLFDISYLLEK